MRTEPVTMNDFADAVRNDLQENLEGIFPGITVSVQQVDKIQGGSYLGLRIDREDGLASPVLNLEQPFEDMQTVRPYERVVSDITRQAEAILRDMPQITLGNLKEYSRLKEGLIMQVIPVKGNEERLADMPHRQMEDMAVVYRMMMNAPQHSGEMSFLVTNSIMQGYGITPEQLYEDASFNMSQNIQYSIRPLFNVLADMNPVFAGDPMPEPDNTLFVCTNEMGVYGAGAVAHPEFMEEACKKMQGNFFVLPSSIHEVLLTGERKHESKTAGKMRQEKPVSLLIDVQKKLREKGPGYARWATVYNLKQMSKTLLFLRDHNIDSAEQLQELAAQKAAKRDELLSSIQTSEKRLAEIATLKKYIINYSKTRATYEAYRIAGYSKKFFEAHREELTLHKAAKQAFDELGVKKLPKVKELNAEYADLLSGKKAAYAEYRKLRDEAQELTVARANIESLYDAEKKETKERQKEKQH